MFDRGGAGDVALVSERSFVGRLMPIAPIIVDTLVASLEKSLLPVIFVVLRFLPISARILVEHTHITHTHEGIQMT